MDWISHWGLVVGGTLRLEKEHPSLPTIDVRVCVCDQPAIRVVPYYWIAFIFIFIFQFL